MKLKENKGMSLMVFTIILAILLVVAGGAIVYLLNNQENVPQNVSGNNQTSNNINNETYEDTNQVADKNETEVNKNEDKIIKKVHIDKHEDIIIEAAYVDEHEYMLVYTRKDKNNNLIWTYKTGTDIEAQHSGVKTSRITEDRIYVDDHGTITVLNKDTGKTIWKWKYENSDNISGNGLANVEYVDEQRNTYVTYGYTLTILDKDGKSKANVTYKDLDLTDAHCGFTYINKTEGIVWGNDEFVIVNLKDYSTKITGTYEDTWRDDNQMVKITYLNVITDDSYEQGLLLRGYKEGEELWAYRTDIEPVAQCDIFGVLEITNDRIYFNEEGNIVVLNKENGKAIWKNSDANNSLIGSHYLDEKQNLYIFVDAYPSGILYIFDKNGKEKAAISDPLLGEYLIGEGPSVKEVNEKELLLGCYTISDNGPEEYDVIISLEDYSIKKVTKIEE